MTSQKADVGQQLTLWGDATEVKEVKAPPEPESKRTKTRSKADGPETEAKARQAASPATTQQQFTYPFNIRYAAEILQLTGFVDGQPYTSDQIKEVLVQNGFTEFQDVQPDFHHNAATNTLVITIRGSRKGG
ncbi:MAG: hypothetical protein HY680_06255 [Chloroflexi bacterium]|nr:hypothetical protein [Chloroflexota bacterium]